MRIALAQINPTVGDVAGNTAKHLQFIERAAAAGADLVVFPEMSVLGYPPKDLLLKPDVIADAAAAVQKIADHCKDLAAIVGYAAASRRERGRPLYNSAALCRDGKILHNHVKHLLPTYDVFDETRYFEPGPAIDLTTVAGAKVGISVCEDLWNDDQLFTRPLYHENPIDQLARLGAQLFVNCSASPFIMGKHAFRLKLLSHTAARHKLPLVYVNQVGGNDELVFDGNSCVVDATGELLAHARDFEEDLLVVDLPEIGHADTSTGQRPTTCGGVNWSASPNPQSAIRDPQCREGIATVYAALELGLRDYCRKCGFKSVVLGLSGGIDSAVTAAVAVAALGAENVTGIAMPSRYSSRGSVDDARKLASSLGVTFHIVPIEGPVAAVESAMAPLFAGTAPGTAEENIQARLRGNILMAFSNKFGSMLVTTGNKSELAVGYCTLYGDMAGGLAVISDVPKTVVYDLALYINSPDCPLHQKLGRAVIPSDSITKPPSAELRPNQTDQDTLPPYEILDQIIERYVERLQPARLIIEETGFDPATVRRVVTMIDRNEYKRQQAAPGLKITGRAFGFGRRMPIAQRYDPSQP
jgi:NAD+ synthase (glutamine-hydrolysing)